MAAVSKLPITRFIVMALLDLLESSSLENCFKLEFLFPCSSGISQLLSRLHDNIWTQQPELQHPAPAHGSHESQKLAAQTATEEERPQKLP